MKHKLIGTLIIKHNRRRHSSISLYKKLKQVAEKSETGHNVELLFLVIHVGRSIKRFQYMILRIHILHNRCLQIKLSIKLIVTKFKKLIIKIASVLVLQNMIIIIHETPVFDLPCIMVTNAQIVDMGD
jgi:hypothetical protein